MPHDPYVLGSNRKIDPYRRRISSSEQLPDGTLNDGNRVEIGPTDLAFEEWAALDLTPPDLPSLRDYRLSRLVGELQRRDFWGIVDVRPLKHPLRHR